MKKHLLVTLSALTLLTTGAWAADSTPPAAAPASGTAQTQTTPKGDWTLAEARKRAHEHADKLDKMTDAEWAAHEKRYHDFHDKWNSMTPEQKEAFKKNLQAKRQNNQNGAVATPPTQPSNGQ